jgi:hypothetical protein
MDSTAQSGIDGVDISKYMQNPLGTSTAGQLNHYIPQKQSPCPHCGYCPHCGRGGHQTYPYYPYPWYQPYIVTCGGNATNAGSLTNLPTNTPITYTSK